MAVPIEFCTAVFLKEQLSARFPGGLDELYAFCDSVTYLEDAHLVRVSFVATRDALALVDRVVERVGTDSGEPLVFAIVDRSVTPENLPPWLAVGDVGGTLCAWISGTSPGPMVTVPKSFSARFLRVPYASFTDKLAALGISVELAAPATIDVTFHRAATRIDATVGVDGEGKLFGILTFPPRSRSVDVIRHDQLLADLESTLRDLGWQGST